MHLFPLAQAGGEAPSSISYDHFVWLHIQFVDSLELLLKLSPSPAPMLETSPPTPGLTEIEECPGLMERAAE